MDAEYADSADERSDFSTPSPIPTPIPIQIGKTLVDHEVFTVREMGWGGFSNGDLLSAAVQDHFQVLIIADKNLRHQ